MRIVSPLFSVIFPESLRNFGDASGENINSAADTDGEIAANANTNTRDRLNATNFLKRDAVKLFISKYLLCL